MGTAIATAVAMARGSASPPRRRIGQEQRCGARGRAGAAIAMRRPRAGPAAPARPLRRRGSWPANSALRGEEEPYLPAARRCQPSVGVAVDRPRGPQRAPVAGGLPAGVKALAEHQPRRTVQRHPDTVDRALADPSGSYHAAGTPGRRCPRRHRRRGLKLQQVGAERARENADLLDARAHRHRRSAGARRYGLSRVELLDRTGELQRQPMAAQLYRDDPAGRAQRPLPRHRYGRQARYRHRSDADRRRLTLTRGKAGGKCGRQHREPDRSRPDRDRWHHRAAGPRRSAAASGRPASSAGPRSGGGPRVAARLSAGGSRSASAGHSMRSTAGGPGRATQTPIQPGSAWPSNALEAR